MDNADHGSSVQEDLHQKVGGIGGVSTRAARSSEKQEPYRILGERLRLARQLRGLSQSCVARELGVTFQQIQKYETGANKMSLVQLIRVCSLLQIDPYILIADFVDWLRAYGEECPPANIMVSAEAYRLGSLARTMVSSADTALQAACCDVIEALLSVDSRSGEVSIHRSRRGDLLTVVVSDQPGHSARRARRTGGMQSQD